MIDSRCWWHEGQVSGRSFDEVLMLASLLLAAGCDDQPGPDQQARADLLAFLCPI